MGFRRVSGTMQGPHGCHPPNIHGGGIKGWLPLSSHKEIKLMLKGDTFEVSPHHLQGPCVSEQSLARLPLISPPCF